MAGSKKSRRKGRKKGKKGKKKVPLDIEPLPLHSLTEVYKKLDNLVRHLLHCRILARKKRIEARLLQDEEISQKRDDSVFKEHIRNMLDDVSADLKNISSRLTQEKEAIQKEVDRIIAEYHKRLLSTFERIEIEEKRLEELQTKLKEYEKLKKMVRELEEKLANIKEEYERIKVEIMIKTTHLRNQYLVLRADLYNYLRQQLQDLIAKVRQCILPIVWDHMADEQRKNRCHRWSFKHEDATNEKLLKIRENYLNKVESLEWGQKYYGTEWAFSSLNEMRHKQLADKLRWKKRLQEIHNLRTLYQTSKKTAIVSVEKTQMKIVADFQVFLHKKLSAVTEARERKERLDRLKTQREGAPGLKQYIAATTRSRILCKPLQISPQSSLGSTHSSVSRTDSTLTRSDDIDDDLEEYKRHLEVRPSNQGSPIISSSQTAKDNERTGKSYPMSSVIINAILSGTEGLSTVEE